MTSVHSVVHGPEDRARGDGFELLKTVDGRLYLQIQHWSGDVENVIRMVERIGIGIDDDHEALARLTAFAGRVQRLSVSSNLGRRLSPVGELEGVEELSLQGDVRSVDFSRLPALRSVFLNDAPTVENLSAARSLQALFLERPRISDLSGLEGMQQLRSLKIRTALKLVSLRGIETLEITELAVDGAKALGSIGAVANLRNLRKLELRFTAAVADLEQIGAVHSLQELLLIGGPRLRGLEFVEGLSGLQELVIANTTVDAQVSLAPLSGLSHLRVLGLGPGINAAEAPEHIGALINLEVLSLEQLPPLESIAFVRGLSRLYSLKIHRTPILDGDLSPLLDLPSLARVYVHPYRKHYAPSEAELFARLSAPGQAPPVDPLRAAASPRAAAPNPLRKGVQPSETEQAWPQRILDDVDWRFDEEVDSEGALVATVQQAREGDEPWDPDAIVLPLRRIRVFLPGDAEFEEEDITLELSSRSCEGFAAAELLYALHIGFNARLRDIDHRYFEGLDLQDVGSDILPPLYTLDLGS